MARWACHRGQAAPEYVGLLLLVGLLATSFASVNLGPKIAAAIRDGFCHALHAECSPASSSVPYGPALPLVDPQLIGPERDRLLDPDPQQRQIDFLNLTVAELAWLELNDPEVYEAASETRSWIEQRDLVDAAMAADLDDFLAYKEDGAHDQRLDYSDDGCSSPVGSSGFFFDFGEACYRHDFGYRNYKRLGVFDLKKAQVDLIFIHDMRESCGDVFITLRRQCRLMAFAYYEAVDKAGGHCDLPGDLGRVPGPCAPEWG